jgi:L-threonylcarbamoyladenylate synthase
VPDARQPILQTQDRNARALAAAALRRGGLVAFATDTVYGIGTASDSRNGIQRLYALKGRNPEKALPILIADQGQTADVAGELPDEAERLMRAFWPGALTLVVQRNEALLPELAPGLDTIGVRLPDRDDLRSLIRLVGSPIACSSANLSGMPAATSAIEVARQFPTGLDFILDGGASVDGQPSTVVDVSRAGHPRVLRDGAISRAKIAQVLGIAL